MINVVHIGARGNPLNEWMPMAEHVNLYGIDADPSAYDQLKKLPKQLNKQKFYNYGVVGTEFNKEFRVLKSPPCSSFLEPNLTEWDKFGHSVRATETKTIKVDTITLDDFRKKHVKGNIDFLKLDVQGLEYEILSTYSELDQIIGIETEAIFLHLYRKQATLYSLGNLLSGYGFYLYELKPCYWTGEKGRQLAFADCLFLNIKYSETENFELLLKKYDLHDTENYGKRAWKSFRINI